MTNPLLEVADLEAVVAFSREHGLVTVIDNTAPVVNSELPVQPFDVRVDRVGRNEEVRGDGRLRLVGDESFED